MQTIYFLKAYDSHYPLGDHLVTTWLPLGDHLVALMAQVALMNLVALVP